MPFQIKITSDGAQTAVNDFNAIAKASNQAATSVNQLKNANVTININGADKIEDTKSNFESLKKSIDVTTTAAASFKGAMLAFKGYEITQTLKQMGVSYADMGRAASSAASAVQTLTVSTLKYSIQAVNLTHDLYMAYAALNPEVQLAIKAAALLGAAYMKLAGPMAEATAKINELKDAIQIASGETGTTSLDLLTASATKLGKSFDELKQTSTGLQTIRTEMGLLPGELNRIIEVMAEFGKVSGSTPEQLQKSMEIITSAMMAGSMDIDQWKELSRTMPLLARAMADTLGNSGKSMRELVDDGKLLTSVMVNGILSAESKIKDKADEIGLSHQEIENKLKNEKTLLLNYVNILPDVTVSFGDMWDEFEANLLHSIRGMIGGLTEIEQKADEIRQRQSAQSTVKWWAGAFAAVGMTGTAQDFEAKARRLQGTIDELQASIDHAASQQDKEDVWKVQADKVKQLLTAYKDTNSVTKLLGTSSGDLANILGDEQAKLLGINPALTKEQEAVLELDKAYEKLKSTIEGMRLSPEMRQTALDQLNAATQQARSQIEAVSAANLSAAQQKYLENTLNAIKQIPDYILKIVDDASAKTGIPKNVILAVMGAESGGVPNKTSPAGAMGLMQLMPGTAAGLGVTEPYNPTQNVMGGAVLLKQLYERYGSWQQVFSAYNSGKPNANNPETNQYVPVVLNALKALDDGYTRNYEAAIKAKQAGDDYIQSLKDNVAIAKEAAAAGMTADAYKKLVEQKQALKNIPQDSPDYEAQIAQVQALSTEQQKYQAVITNQDVIKSYQDQLAVLQQQTVLVDANTQAWKDQDEIRKSIAKLDVSDPNYQQRVDQLTAIIKATQDAKHYLEDLGTAQQLLDKISPSIKAQDEYAKTLRAVNILEQQGAITAEQRAQAISDATVVLEKAKAPNQEYLNTLRQEIAIYTDAAARGLSPDQLQQELATRQEIAKLNKYSPTYAQDVEQVKQMVPELEKLKQAFQDNNKEAEIFKSAASDIFKSWTDAFESIFEKGLKGFSTFKDQVVSIFRRMLAEFATLSVSQAIIAPLIATVGGLLGVSQSSLAAVMKQLGAGASATMPGFSLSGIWQGLTGLFGGGATSASAAAVTGGSSFDALWAARTGMTPPTAAASPSLGAYGMAGMGGYLAGSFLGGGTIGSQLGGAGGAIGGLLLGNMLFPGLGGMIGGAVGGSVLGSLLGGLFGGGGTPKQRLVTMSGGDTGQYDIAQGTRMMIETAFGKFGFGQATKNMDDWLLNQGKQMLQMVQQTDSQLAAMLKPEEMEKAKAAVANWSQSGKDAEAAVLERYRLIIDSTNTLWKSLATSATTAEDMLKRFQSVRTLSDLVGKDLSTEVAKAMETQYGQAIDKMQEDTKSLLSTLDGFTGTTEQLQSLTTAMQDKYNLELQLLTQIKTTIKAIDDSFATTIEGIRQSMMTTAQLYPYLTQQAQTLAGSILTLKDPAEIQETINRIMTLVGQAYNLMTPEQKNTVGNQYIDWLQQVQALADYQLNSVKDQVVSESQQTAKLITDAMNAATENQAAVFQRVGDAIIAAIQALKPAGMATGGFVPGAWNGKHGTAGDTIIAALTPGEAVIPRAIAQQHRELIGAMTTGQVRYMAKGMIPRGLKPIPRGLKPIPIGLSPIPEILPIRDWEPQPDITPVPIPTPAVSVPVPTSTALPSLPAMPDISIHRTDLQSLVMQIMTAVQNGLLQASQQQPGWDEVGYRQEVARQAQAAVLAAAGDPDKQLAALQNLQQAVMARYSAEMEQVNALKQAAKGIGDYLTSLSTSDLSPLTAKQKLAAAQRQYEDTLRRAQGGDVTAAAGLQGAAQTYLQQSRGYYASSPAYTAIYSAVTQGLTQFAAQGGETASQRTFAEMQDSLTQIVDVLNQINATQQVGADVGNLRLPGMAAGGFVEPAPLVSYPVNVIPFPSARMREQDISRLEQKLSDVVERLDKLGVIVQVTTQDQTRTLVQSKPPPVSRSASTKEVF